MYFIIVFILFSHLITFYFYSNCVNLLITTIKNYVIDGFNLK